MTAEQTTAPVVHFTYAVAQTEAAQQAHRKVAEITFAATVHVKPVVPPTAIVPPAISVVAVLALLMMVHPMALLAVTVAPAVAEFAVRTVTAVLLYVALLGIAKAVLQEHVKISTTVLEIVALATVAKTEHAQVKMKLSACNTSNKARLHIKPYSH